MEIRSFSLLLMEIRSFSKGFIPLYFRNSRKRAQGKNMKARDKFCKIKQKMLFDAVLRFCATFSLTTGTLRICYFKKVKY